MHLRSPRLINRLLVKKGVRLGRFVEERRGLERGEQIAHGVRDLSRARGQRGPGAKMLRREERARHGCAGSAVKGTQFAVFRGGHAVPGVAPGIGYDRERRRFTGL